METIAVYWESRIKTYGFQRIPDLALIEFSCPLSDIKPVGEIFSQNYLKIFSPKFIIAHEIDNQISFILCLPNKQGKDFHATLKKNLKVNPHKIYLPCCHYFLPWPTLW